MVYFSEAKENLVVIRQDLRGAEMKEVLREQAIRKNNQVYDKDFFFMSRAIMCPPSHQKSGGIDTVTESTSL